MTGFAIQGWCPDAWRPMAAGDGLLVRIGPPLGRLTRAQAMGLCAAAIAHGNGQIDATSRARLQIRGAGADWRALVERLAALGLVARDPARERRGNIIVAPDWCAGDDTQRIATDLTARLCELPVLPDKTGFVIDAGPAPVLGGDPGDFRIERAADGRLILRADGRAGGVALDHGGEAAALIALAGWFAASGGRTRMARHHAPLPGWARGAVAPAPPAPAPRPGAHPLGSALAIPFGRIDAAALARFVAGSGLTALRLTPWRMVIAEGVAEGVADAAPAGFVATPDAPVMRADACVGAPACRQATVATRALAARLAPFVTGRLHVSGCAKGCARARPADVVLTGRDGRFDLAFAARAGDPPAAAGLDAAGVLARFGAA